MTVADTARVHSNVRIGEGSTVEDFCVLGHPGPGHREGEAALQIGRRALIRSHTVIYAGCTILDDFSSGHGVLIRQDNEVGEQVSIGSGSVIEFAVVIGARVRLHSQCFVPEYCVLEEDSWLGPGARLTNSRFPEGLRAKATLQGVLVQAGARIGAGACILPGITIGRGALVGAGSVVTRDVPDDTVVVGNPARLAGRTSELRDDAGLVYGTVNENP